MLPKLAEVGSFFPKMVAAKDAPCKQVILRGDGVDLNRIPVLKTWPQDGGPLHHAALCHHAGSEDREAQRGDVSHAGLRRPDDGNALAAAEGSGGAYARAAACGLGRS